MASARESRIAELSSQRRVLIVDDHQDTAELTAMVLANHGHDVKVAYDGQSALALALEFRPQMALLDLSLPDMDGYQLASLMRAAPSLSDCLLVAISGYCSEQDRARSRALGFENHLAKPLSVDGLLEAIAACASKTAAHTGGSRVASS